MELSTDRPVTGMGIAPIPFGAIVRYMDEDDVLDRRRFRSLIRVMDSAVLERSHAKAKEAASRSKPAPAPSVPSRSGRRR